MNISSLIKLHIVLFFHFHDGNSHIILNTLFFNSAVKEAMFATEIMPQMTLLHLQRIFNHNVKINLFETIFATKWHTKHISSSSLL